jgi:hypothetical protein
MFVHIFIHCILLNAWIILRSTFFLLIQLACTSMLHSCTSKNIYADYSWKKDKFSILILCLMSCLFVKSLWLLCFSSIDNFNQLVLCMLCKSSWKKLFDRNYAPVYVLCNSEPVPLHICSSLFFLTSFNLWSIWMIYWRRWWCRGCLALGQDELVSYDWESSQISKVNLFCLVGSNG